MPIDGEAVRGFRGALNALRDRPFLRNPKYGEQQWRATRTGAHIGVVLFERKFVRRCKKLGIPMFCHNMVRSEAEQNELVVKGVSRTTDSAHEYGMACDIVHGIRAWNLTDLEWTLLGHIGSEVAMQNGLPIAWGGEWEKFPDPAHWEIKDWRKSIDGFPFPEGE